MSKLDQINNIIDEARELAESFREDFNEEVAKYNALLKEYEVLKKSIELSTLQEIDEALNGIQHLPEQIVEPIIECEDETAYLNEMDQLEPYEIQQPKEGLLAARVWGIVGSVTLFLIFGIVGAVMKRLNLNPSMISMEFFQEVYGFYSDLIIGTSHAGPALGLVLSGGISILGGYLIYLLLAMKAARTNLAKAQAIFEDVKHYIEEKEPIRSKMKEFISFLERALYHLKGAKVFGDEYERRVKRARFFEGDDFETFHNNSKEEVKDLQKIYAKLKTLAALKLFEQNGKIADEVENYINEVEKDIEYLKAKVYS